MQGCLRSFAALKKHPRSAHAKVILSVGGGGEGSNNFASMARDPFLRRQFAASAKEMVDYFGLDGIDSI